MQNICANRQQQSKSSYLEMARSKVEVASKLKSSNNQLSGVQKKLKFHAEHQHSVRDMRSQVLEAELQLKAEQAARRQAEDRYVFVYTDPHTDTPNHLFVCTGSRILLSLTASSRRTCVHYVH